MLYNTSQLEKEIKQQYKKASVKTEKKYFVKVDDIISFSECKGFSIPGIYVFADDKRYYIKEIGDRGGIVEAKSTVDIDEICYWACHELVAMAAMKFAMSNREIGKDWRRNLFQRELELLYRISPVYFKKGKQDIDKILEESPFDDSLFT